MSIELQVVDDPAQVCADALTAAVSTGEHVVLTGGSSPRHAYELAAAQHAERWRGAKLWFTDDRCVPPDDELSNFRMVRGSLLEPLETFDVEGPGEVAQQAPNPKPSTKQN